MLGKNMKDWIVPMTGTTPNKLKEKKSTIYTNNACLSAKLLVILVFLTLKRCIACDNLISLAFKWYKICLILSCGLQCKWFRHSFLMWNDVTVLFIRNFLYTCIFWKSSERLQNINQQISWYYDTFVIIASLVFQFPIQVLI